MLRNITGLISVGGIPPEYSHTEQPEATSEIAQVIREQMEQAKQSEARYDSLEQSIQASAQAATESEIVKTIAEQRIATLGQIATSDPSSLVE